MQYSKYSGEATLSKQFRKVILQLHLWIGITTAILMILTGASGALLVFEDEIDHALNPNLARVSPSRTALSLDELKSTVEQQYPGYHLMAFDLSEAPNISFGAYLQPASGQGMNIAVDQYSGKVLGVWNDHRFTRQLHDFHTHLLAGKLGSELVGWSAVILLFLSASGLILWWRTKIVRVNFQTSGPKFQYDLHSTTGVFSLFFLLLFAFTGVVVHWEGPARTWASQVSHTSMDAGDLRSEQTAPGTPMLQPAQLLTIAHGAMPGARATGVILAGSPDSPALVLFKFPEDHTPAGRTRVFLDAYSGKVLSLTSSREAPWAVNYVTRLNREIHTGDIGGWPTRIVAAVFSLALPLLAVTGPLLWWMRRQRAR